MGQLHTFRDFYKLHSKIFRFFGVVPIYRTPIGGGVPKINAPIMAGIALFLIIYWTGVIFTFLIDKHLNDKISVISNWIQMLGNSFALTATLVCTATKYADFDNIISQFEKIDQNLLAVGHQIDYAAQLRRSRLVVLIHLTSMAVVMGYDFYVTIDMYAMTSSWYWLVSVTPLFVYSMCLYHAMFMIYWIKNRCSLVNKTLKTIRLNDAQKGSGGGILFVQPRSDPFFSPEAKERTNSPLSLNGENQQPKFLDKALARSTGKILLRQKSMDSTNLDMNVLTQLFSVMNDLCKLSRKIDEYYGLFFLTSIGALFSITSIQVYYCYVTAISFNEELKFSMWTLMVSINLVTVNLSLIVGITTVCENVSNEATRILQNFSALQIKRDVVSGILFGHSFLVVL